ERAKGSTFYGFSGSPKALDEDETELLDKLEMVSKTQ
ncbi:unnamed protein product, partial [Brassica napus]